MNNIEFLQQVLAGGTPNIDEFVAILGDRFPLLNDYESTPQDSEWHAEGNVHIHSKYGATETPYPCGRGGVATSKQRFST